MECRSPGETVARTWAWPPRDLPLAEAKLICILRTTWRGRRPESLPIVEIYAGHCNRSQANTLATVGQVGRPVAPLAAPDWRYRVSRK